MATCIGQASSSAATIGARQIISRKRSNKGNIDAAVRLGEVAIDGRGLAHDSALALKVFALADQAGNAQGTSDLGDMYYYGQATAVDYTKAVELYGKAAKQGVADAQTGMGMAYLFGHGVPRDYATAFQYFTLAAKQGSRKAMNELGLMYSSGWGVERDVGKAASFYRAAADLGSPVAKYNLGQMYQRGRGVPKNLQTARELYNAAGEAGYGQAYYKLGLIYRDGLDDEPVNLAVANKWFRLAVNAGFKQAASFIVAEQPPAATRNFGAVPDTAAPAGRVVATGARVAPGPRLALVIANGDYAPNLNALKNPVNDGKLIATSLRAARFDVTSLANLDVGGIKKALADFGDKVRKAGPNTTALFYYAGHGAAVEGVNYLIPVKVPIASKTALQSYGESVDDVVRVLDTAKPTTTIVILDACRSVAFPGERGGSGGLVEVRPRNGSLIAFSTAPGQTAADGDGDHSPYAAALAAEIAHPTQPSDLIIITFQRVRAKISDASTIGQTPWEQTSLRSDVSFAPD